MSLGSTVEESSSSTLVDSADSGSHEEASLFWTSTSLVEKAPITAKRTSAPTSTTHLVTRPVRAPAI